MNIAVVRNRRAEASVIARLGQPCPESYGEKTIHNVAQALMDNGHRVEVMEGDITLLGKLASFMPPDSQDRPTGLVFNMAYGVQGECRYTHVPAALEMAGIPYTGSSPLGHALALDKVITKQLLRDVGVPTPNYRVMSGADECADGLHFPVVVKPRHESTSFGLRLVTERDGLAEAVAAIVTEYQQDALVEEYIDGREVAVGLVGNDDLECLPLVECRFSDGPARLVTWEHKNYRLSGVAEQEKVCPAPMPNALAERLREISIATFRACHCRDYARVDIRIDPAGNPYVLEINSMASLGPSGSYVKAAQVAGYDFPALVNRIVEAACKRYVGLIGGGWGEEPAPQVVRTLLAKRAAG